MLNDEIIGYMLQNAYKKGSMPIQKPVEVKSEISEKEALDIFNEILEVYKSHNVSYQCACRLSLALNEAFITGAVELYNQDNP